MKNQIDKESYVTLLLNYLSSRSIANEEYVENTNTKDLYDVYVDCYKTEVTLKVEEKFQLDNLNFMLSDEDIEKINLKALLNVQIEIFVQERALVKNFDVEKMKNVLVVTPMGIMQVLTQEEVDEWNY